MMENVVAKRFSDWHGRRPRPSCGKRSGAQTGFLEVPLAAVENFIGMERPVAWKSTVEHAPREKGKREGKLWIVGARAREWEGGS